MQQQTIKRTTVDIDTRRTVAAMANSRKPHEVKALAHEKFLVETLKSRLGWGQRDTAPQSIIDAAKQMAAFLIKRDAELADKKAKDEAEAAKD